MRKDTERVSGRAVMEVHGGAEYSPAGRTGVVHVAAPCCCPALSILYRRYVL